MIRIICLVAACMIAWPVDVSANPVGTYNVAGQNPEDGSKYTGTRFGQVYNVFWNVAGEEFSGTGIGAAMVNGEMIFGTASN